MKLERFARGLAVLAFGIVATSINAPTAHAARSKSAPSTYSSAVSVEGTHDGANTTAPLLASSRAIVAAEQVAAAVVDEDHMQLAAGKWAVEVRRVGSDRLAGGAAEGWRCRAGRAAAVDSLHKCEAFTGPGYVRP